MNITATISVLNIDRAAAVLAVCFPEDGWTASGFTHWLHTPDHHALLACNDNEVQGVLLYFLGEDKAAVRAVAVTPAQRRRGVALQLLAGLYQRLARDLDAMVDEHDLPAQLVLKKAGYRCVAQFRGVNQHDAAGHDCSDIYIFSTRHTEA